MEIARGRFLLALCLLAAGLVYLRCLPVFVQGGDTAELVSAAYLRLVAHPPGYPLWVWLMHFFISFTRVLSGESVFWRAAFVNMLLAVGSLGLLCLPLRRKPVALLLCFPLVAFSTAFRESAVLPEVFSLLALLVSLIGWLFLFGKAESRPRQWLVPFVLALGLAHHLTIVLMAPVLLAMAVEHWKKRAARGRVLLGSALGALVAALSYASLLLMNPQHPHSWGSLRSAADLAGHFLRRDYGVFQLAAGEGGLTLAPLLFFLSSTLLEGLPLLAVSVWCLRRNPRLLRERRVQAWLACLFLSLLFFTAQNIEPRGTGAEVLLRFHVLPLVQLAFLCAYLLWRTELSRRQGRVALAASVPFVIYLAFCSAQMGALRKDSVVEDYARNLLGQAGRQQPAILLVEGDAAFYGVRYVQGVLGEGKDVLVAAPQLLFHRWFVEKLQGTHPAFRLGQAERVWGERELELGKDFVLPNLERFSIVVNRAVQERESFRLTFLGLGRRLSQGSGTAFDPESLSGLRVNGAPGAKAWGDPQGHSKRWLFSQYSFFHLARGLQLHRQGKGEEAGAEWEMALGKVRYALPALLNLCKLREGRDPRCSPENIEAVAKTARGIF